MENKSKIVNILNAIKIIFICIVSFIFLRQCKEIVDNIGNIKPDLKSDTITNIIHTRDTIWQDTFKIIKVNVKVPGPRDTIFIIDSVPQPISIYQDSLRDSSVVLYYTDYVKGEMIKKDLSYRLLVPKIIIDSVKTTVISSPIYNLQAGAIVGKNTLAPVLDFSIKRHTFGVGYNFQNSGVLVSYKYKIFSK